MKSLTNYVMKYKNKLFNIKERVQIYKCSYFSTYPKFYSAKLTQEGKNSTQNKYSNKKNKKSSSDFSDMPSDDFSLDDVKDDKIFSRTDFSSFSEEDTLAENKIKKGKESNKQKIKIEEEYSLDLDYDARIKEFLDSYSLTEEETNVKNNINNNTNVKQKEEVSSKKISSSDSDISEYGSSSEKGKKEKDLYEHSILKSLNFKNADFISSLEQFNDSSEIDYIWYESKLEDELISDWNMPLEKRLTVLIKYMEANAVKRFRTASLTKYFTTFEIREYEIPLRKIESVKEFKLILVVLYLKNLFFRKKNRIKYKYDEILSEFLIKNVNIKDETSLVTFFFSTNVNKTLEIPLLKVAILKKLKEIFKIPLNDKNIRQNWTELEMSVLLKYFLMVINYLSPRLSIVRQVTGAESKDPNNQLYQNILTSLINFYPHLHEINYDGQIFIVTRMFSIFNRFSEFKILKDLMDQSFRELEVISSATLHLYLKNLVSYMCFLHVSKMVSNSELDKFSEFLVKLNTLIKEKPDIKIRLDVFQEFLEFVEKFTGCVKVYGEFQIDGLFLTNLRELMIIFFDKIKMREYFLLSPVDNPVFISVILLEYRVIMRRLEKHKDKKVHSILQWLNRDITQFFEKASRDVIIHSLQFCEGLLAPHEKKEIMNFLFQKLGSLKQEKFGIFNAQIYKLFRWNFNNGLIMSFKQDFMMKLFYTSLENSFDDPELNIPFLLSNLTKFLSYGGNLLDQTKQNNNMSSDLIPKKQSDNEEEIKTKQYTLTPNDFSNAIEKIFDHLKNNYDAFFDCVSTPDSPFNLIFLTLYSHRSQHLLEIYYYPVIYSLLVILLRNAKIRTNLDKFLVPLNASLVQISFHPNNLDSMTYHLKLYAKGVILYKKLITTQEDKKNLLKILDKFTAYYKSNPQPYDAVAKKHKRLIFLNYILRTHSQIGRELSGKGKLEIIKVNNKIKKTLEDNKNKQEAPEQIDQNSGLTDSFFFTN